MEGPALEGPVIEVEEEVAICAALEELALVPLSRSLLVAPAVSETTAADLDLVEGLRSSVVGAELDGEVPGSVPDKPAPSDLLIAMDDLCDPSDRCT